MIVARFVLLACLPLLGVAFGSLGWEDRSPPTAFALDPATGSIGGRVAVAVLPAQYDQDNIEPLYPWGFHAYLTPEEDPDRELVYPCGSWFQPPHGRYRLRVEGEWSISPYSLTLIYSGRPFRGRGISAAMPVVAAGRVVLPQREEPASHLVLRLLHAGSYLERGFPRWELTRRKAVREIGDGLLMPVGSTLGALWDTQSQRYVALSRPFEVQARKTVEVPLHRPVGQAHLVVELQRDTVARTAAENEVDLVLRRGGEELAPAVEVATANRIYAVWYGLNHGVFVLQARSQDSYLDPKRFELRPGSIERLTVKLKPLRW